MTFSADELEDGAHAATGLDDFGSSYYREGLDRTVHALNTEAELNDLGRVMQHATISNALIQRLKIIDAYKAHPEIADEVADVTVVWPKGRSRNGFEGQIRQSAGNPGNCCFNGV